MLEIKPEDGFLAVAVRRAAAWQLGKPIVELETTTVGEPDFIVPWDKLAFLMRIETELGKPLSLNKTLLPSEHNKTIPPNWFHGPAVKMPMSEWTKIAVEHFLAPIRDEIVCPKYWTPLEPETKKEKVSFPANFSDWFWSCFGFSIVAAPIVAILTALPGLFWNNWLKMVPKFYFFIFLYFCFWWLVIIIHGRFFAYNKPESISMNNVPPPLLLGTLTFHENQLQIADDMTQEGTLKILPSEYRCFLFYGDINFDRPSYLFLTTQKILPTYDLLLDLIMLGYDKNESVQRVEVVIDSGLITITELPIPYQIDWIPGPNRQTVDQILQREDKTICGLKLLPSYGDGDYYAFARKTESVCEVVVELIAPEESFTNEN